MESSVRVYRCGELRPGERVFRERGVKVGATLGDAIAQWANRGVAYGDVWPLRLFEGSVMPADVLSTEEHAMRVRALVVEREVPLREAFGPRTEDLVRLIDSMDGTRWLRPDGRAGSVARIAELIAEHYAALLDYGPVTAPSACRAHLARGPRLVQHGRGEGRGGNRRHPGGVRGERRVRDLHRRPDRREQTREVGLLRRMVGLLA